MLQSQLFSLTHKTDPTGSEAVSHKLLVRGGYIDQLGSGIWSLLPLGFRVFTKIQNIIRQEMNAIAGQEILMPALQPKSLWEETDRFAHFDPQLFTVTDRHKKTLVLAPTHEEVITDLARKYIRSYRQLPIAVYQIQTKFRNELRATGGLLRVREFSMKDLYSFHVDKKDLDRYYDEVAVAYGKIYRRCGLDAVMVEASSGSIGGSKSNEFMAFTEVGEDRVFVCNDCHTAFNSEVRGAEGGCPRCGKELSEKRGIELGHIFQLGDVYSHKMKAVFTDRDGAAKDLVMGCYGIGVGRLLATVAEIHHDNDGMVWPEELSPFHVHLLSLSRDPSKIKKARDFYARCKLEGFEVLLDDREELPGVKFKDADLLGISLRLVIGDKTGDMIEYRQRASRESRVLGEDQVVEEIKRFYTSHEAH